MRRLSAILAVLLLAMPAAGQVLVVEANRTGTYYVQITVSPSGSITLTEIPNLARLGEPTTPPGGDGDGGDDGGGELSELSRVAHESIPAADPRAGINAQKLAVGFRALAGEIGQRFVPDPDSDAPWQKLADATTRMRRALLGDAYQTWHPWTRDIGDALRRLENAGQLRTAEQMRDAYLQIARGLEYSPGEARGDLAPHWRDLILQIVAMILEQLFAQTHQE